MVCFAFDQAGEVNLLVDDLVVDLLLVQGQLLADVVLALVQHLLHLLQFYLAMHFRLQLLLDREQLLQGAFVYYVSFYPVQFLVQLVEFRGLVMLLSIHELLDEVRSLLDVSLAFILQMANLLLKLVNFVQCFFRIDVGSIKLLLHF